ncbi:hypothetical protein RM543_04430 [Roseicyclus sp. F158]|uniref:Uncharacterized protein n=1 Tax=Tropicimonas omnivorans TaxID=3075590 RepID=A0ABU3DDX5_9RHOB|nr:hypothetical protein [Roseicyclus sp. F158]MDT0681922.1 hypothetical protein [Roseicyclus sp. F158]
MAGFTIAFVAQDGRLQYEALLLAASLREMDPGFDGRLVALEPQPGGAWPGDPRISSLNVREALQRLDVEITPFRAEHFGAAYPNGNKIEGLSALPEGPFLFLDSDTLVTGALSDVPFDWTRPSASMRREGTWPEPPLYGPGYTGIWGSLYDRFGLDLEPTLDLSQPDEHWERYLYFNAGWFYGADAPAFGARFLDYSLSIRNDPPEALACQSLDPWLDQIALPLVIHSLNGGRPGPELAGLDGDVTCHWRVLSLLYARESDRTVEILETVSQPNWLKKALKEHEPFRRLLFQGKGHRLRALFDRADLPRPEQALRNRIKKEKMWYR